MHSTSRLQDSHVCDLNSKSINSPKEKKKVGWVLDFLPQISVIDSSLSIQHVSSGMESP